MEPVRLMLLGPVGRVVLWVSVGLYGVGVFSAYLLGPLLMKFG